MKKILIISFLSVILLFVSAYLVFQLTKSRTFQFYGGLVNKVETTEKVVALTFDDGPGKNTDDILRILAEGNVKATFFLTGREMEEDMDATKRIVAAGHEIGNHSYSHQRMVLKTPGFVKEEIERTDTLIREAGYEGDIHFRPPYGKRLLVLPHYLAKHDRLTIYMGIEPESYPDVATDADKIADYVVEHIEPGAIILLHVMYESRMESLASVEKIVSQLKAQGYEFVTVSELLGYGER